MDFRHRSRRNSISLALAACAFLILYAAMPPGIRAAQAETLTVATDTAYLPFEFRENGKYVGFDMDLLDLITHEMGVSYTLLPMDFSNIFANLTAGKVDMAIAGITITQDRERSMDFSDPYFRSDISLVVANDNTAIDRFADLAGKRVGVKRGTDAADYVNRLQPPATVTYFQNMDAGFPYLEVAAGRLDALVHDTANVRYYSQNKGQGLVKVADTVATPNHFYAIAMPRNSALTQRVNAALRKVIETGSYASIYHKWFGVAPDPAQLMLR
ncbi:transporter substrate-binding domain-containing protein [Advenella mimigardefordensis]|uniref:Glutamine-binding periplasmic protein n=1 Tax=Advenella mimigardefordensis (strain DSM 17166 / LMG 22922 / DPN7) TaxID=1247726 RepID=W0PFF3_ADVMD|nr:transporter substrate-binding domain-containing protein [Advenella mimigardefordensis]AHG65724.1 glutamine-binding periplasmic protein [Advenella mimigardefordensis DPN7]